MTVAEANRKRRGHRRRGGKTIYEADPVLARQILVADPHLVSSGSHWKFPWRCDRGHVWMARPNNRMSGTGCAVCKGRKAVAGESSLLHCFPTIAGEICVFDPDLLTAHSGVKPPWRYREGHTWVARVADRTDGYGCPSCYSRRSVSLLESEVAEFVSTLAGGVMTSTREVLGGAELDIFVPESRIAVEFNGVYWHSEKFLPHDYHLSKSEKCRAAGIQLIHVWEDDWKYRREVVERMLARKLGSSSEPRVNARDLDKEKVSSKQAREFLSENHLQGFSSGREYYALSDASGPRAILVMKRRGNGEWELVRYATNAIVRGGHSRLFSWFLSDHPEVSRVVTFADRGVSSGALYESCGFQRETELAPDYMYVVRGRREHKFNFRKKRFQGDPNLQFRDGLTERELADLNGLLRVYDCGKIRYAWTR